jgi:hypothetical protein
MADPDRTNADAERVSDIVKPFVLERHDDDDGSIDWEVWDHRPASYRRLLTLNDSPDNEGRNAKADAQRIVNALNRADIIEAQSKALAEAREALKPFAAIVEQLDREMPRARNGKVTIVHPLDGILPELYGKTDHECPVWPLPDDLEIIEAWRYHDPVPISEHIVIQMVHLRAAARAFASLTPTPENPNG